MINKTKIDEAATKYLAQTGLAYSDVAFKKGVKWAEEEMAKQKKEELINSYPHCWGKMVWILEYESGSEPPTSVCNCEFGSQKCLKLTRDNNAK